MTTTREVSVLVPELRTAALQLQEGFGIEATKLMNQNVHLEIYCTTRTLQDQANLYCNGHTKEQAMLKAEYLRYDLNLDKLADILEAANNLDSDADDTQPTTQAVPGESFHSFGMAFDAVPILCGRAVWDKKHKLWTLYGDLVKSHGLFWAGDWRHFKEYPHVQLVQESNPLRYFRPGVVMAKLREIGAL